GLVQHIPFFVEGRQCEKARFPLISPAYHFEDLRDGTHGGSGGRKDEEAHFEKAVRLLAPIARQVLTEMNPSFLLDTGQLTETGLLPTADGGLNASWALSWLEQQAAPANRAASVCWGAASTTLICEGRWLTVGR